MGQSPVGRRAVNDCPMTCSCPRHDLDLAGTAGRKPAGPVVTAGWAIFQLALRSCHLLLGSVDTGSAAPLLPIAEWHKAVDREVFDFEASESEASESEALEFEASALEASGEYFGAQVCVPLRGIPLHLPSQRHLRRRHRRRHLHHPLPRRPGLSLGQNRRQIVRMVFLQWMSWPRWWL